MGLSVFDSPLLMVKLRSARYCNIKLLLIFLVIYGHLIEPGIWNLRVLMLQYKGIYLFHMPLFAFLSGLFLKSSESCKHQLWKLLPLYLLLQTVSVALGDGKVKFLTPYWHLWYLLSCSMWTGIAWLWYAFCGRRGKYVLLAVAVVAGCLAGYMPNVGRVMSLSRTVVFFPYFWLGMLFDPETRWERLRFPALLCTVAALILLLLVGERITPAFLYQSAPFTVKGSGALLRLFCYFTGASLCFLLLSVVPGKRFPFTRAGADTLPAYLFHAPVVLHIRKWNVPWPLCILITAVLLYLVHKLVQWHSKLYGITERRG